MLRCGRHGLRERRGTHTEDPGPSSRPTHFTPAPLVWERGASARSQRRQLAKGWALLSRTLCRSQPLHSTAATVAAAAVVAVAPLEPALREQQQQQQRHDAAASTSLDHAHAHTPATNGRWRGRSRSGSSPGAARRPTSASSAVAPPAATGRASGPGGRGRGRGRGRHAAVPRPARQPGLQYEKEVVPLAREAERDLLPDGQPNTPHRRLAYQLRQAATVQELQALLAAHRHDTNVWSGHHTALTVHRLAALLYPRAVAAGAVDRDDPELALATAARGTAAAAGAGSATSSATSSATTSSSSGSASSGRVDPALKAAANSVLSSLSGRLTKDAVRQVQGFHLARLLVSMTWLHMAWGPTAEPVVAAAVRELLRPGAGKLARVAALDPALFGRLVRALAVLMPRHEPLWVDLQRLTLAALLTARADGGGGGGGGGALGQGSSSAAAGGGWEGAGAGGGAESRSGARAWGSALVDQPRSRAAAGGPKEPPSSLPDASPADLINLAFGFAAAGHVAPPVFDALREALLARPLGGAAAGPEPLASLLWAWARAQQPPGQLARRAVEAFAPHLDTAPARPLGRLLWSTAVLGLRNTAFVTAAAAAVTRRQLVFGSPQELVNVTWAFSQLGFRMQHGVGNSGGGGGGAAGGGGEAVAAAAGQGAGAGRRRGPQRGPRAGQQQQEEEDGDGDEMLAEDSEDREQEEQEEQEEEQDSRSGAARRGGRRGSGATVSLAAARAALESAGSDDEGPSSAPAAAPSASGAVAAAAEARLRPLPLAVVQQSAAARAAARAAAPPPEPGTPAALYRWLAHCYLHSYTGSAARWSMSDSQLAALAGAFAAAGYANRPLFYTMGRMAMRRLPTLTAADLTQLITAFARVRLRHDALLERVCALAEAQGRAFTPQQQAQVLWVVQALMPRARYAAVAEGFRRQQLQQLQQQQRQGQGQGQGAGSEGTGGGGGVGGGAVAVEALGRSTAGAAAPPGWEGAAQGGVQQQREQQQQLQHKQWQRQQQSAARGGAQAVPVPLLPLDVPAHLLADADWESDLEEDDDEGYHVEDFDESDSGRSAHGSDYDGSGSGGADEEGGWARVSAVDGTMWGGRRRRSMRSVDELEEWGAAAH
ncbi:hypothetical protein HYH02_009592 [Chlamydomonas schloesseri]|uniref:RAP domain-containing protein n=1 Tax=Chlamydomonas schloesseri TaxID=2026947 RepID=A0A835TBH1_9CHLO|nr:hypothetical protein HYH02_009592 [Chlamydomonas schloesseri]|eukprot:KAG2442103.1 hypothetical protein HYH02_009592 [Chlamydomonas schloesseri]